MERRGKVRESDDPDRSVYHGEAVKKSIEKPNRLTQRRKATMVRKDIKEVRVRFSLRLSPALREENVNFFTTSQRCIFHPRKNRRVSEMRDSSLPRLKNLIKSCRKEES